MCFSLLFQKNKKQEKKKCTRQMQVTSGREAARSQYTRLSYW